VSFPSQELFIKVCGITNLADAKLASSLGANAIGFNFTLANERYITPENAFSISRQIPDYVSKIGVFENSNHQYVKNILNQVSLSAVQLFGNEGPDDLVGYETSVIKVFELDNLSDVEIMRNYLVDAFLLRNKNSKSIHFHSKQYHWDKAVKAKEYGRVILSTDLNPENVEDAIRFVKPYGIDVCAGVELQPGRKDPAQLRELIARARNIIFIENHTEDIDDEN
jgi:phosphoribosylanthranilate isomerase